MTGVDVAIRDGEGRDRMVLDLLLRLPPGLTPETVWDIGCGDGGYTAMLARRFPAAAVHGLETDAMLLARARRRAGVDWREGGVEAIGRGAGLVFSSGLKDLAARLGGLAGKLANGGALAVIGEDGQDLEACYAALEPVCGAVDVWRSEYLRVSEFEAPRLAGGLFVVAVR